MTNNQPEPSPNRRLWLIILTRTSIAFGAILLVAIIGGALYARNFINEKLAPLVESNLKQLLGRPVEIGEVERFSLNSLRFDSAAIPATPDDRDRAVAEAVEVRFDLWQLLTNRILELNVTLIEPDIYLDQTRDGSWISTRIETQEGGDNFIEIELETIQTQNADIVLAPTAESGRPKGTVAIADLDGIVRLDNPDRLIEFEVSGQPTSGGKLAITGEYLPTAEQTKLVIAGQNLVVADVSRLLDLPVTLLAGRADANLNVQLQPNQEQPVIVGTATLNNVTAQIENIPQKFINTQGKLLFLEGQNIALENFSTRRVAKYAQRLQSLRSGQSG
jgi:translocation and assembly module TamB